MTKARLTLRSLRSTGITPLHHYYDPSDSRQSARSAPRVSHVPVPSFCARRPLTPQAALRLHLLASSTQVTGFNIMGSLADSRAIYITRPNRVPLSLRLTLPSKRRFGTGITPCSAHRTNSRTSNYSLTTLRSVNGPSFACRTHDYKTTTRAFLIIETVNRSEI